MSRLFRSLLTSAAIAGVSYYMRNRRASRAMASSPATPDRGVRIYDNHPIAE